MKQNIVILGAGFAGVRAALDLVNYLRFCNSLNIDELMKSKKFYRISL